MFEEIATYEKWSKIEKINKGWSSDTKYYIEAENNQKYLLRISDRDKYEQKKKEYEVICKFSKLGFTMSEPINLGVCNDGQNIFMLLTWVEGENLELALPKLDQEKQYQLGREAGAILRKIHSLEVPPEELPTQTKIPKKIAQLQRYIDSEVRIPGDNVAIDFIRSNIERIWSKPPVYQHGDFHPGNLILTPDKRIGVIDFNRWEIGDPYEEFYKLESFSTEVSIPYCIGQIDEYFDENIPEDFWDILAVYVAHASLYSIKWAEQFGQKDIDHMVKICKKSFNNYEAFKLRVPKWYVQNWGSHKGEKY